MRHFLFGWVLWGASLLPAGTCALDNGSFDNGLLNWKAAWHVTATGDEAQLTDAQAPHAFLFQAGTPGMGPFTITFDFADGLSSDVPAGTFNDSFYASLYYVNRLSDFILEHDRFDSTQGLFDLDANGTFNLNGSVSPSPKGAGWSRYTGTFTAAHTSVIIVFELYDLNFVTGDSSMRIDNVSITAGAPP